MGHGPVNPLEANGYYDLAAAVKRAERWRTRRGREREIPLAAQILRQSTPQRAPRHHAGVVVCLRCRLAVVVAFWTLRAVAVKRWVQESRPWPSRYFRSLIRGTCSVRSRVGTPQQQQQQRQTSAAASTGFVSMAPSPAPASGSV